MGKIRERRWDCSSCGSKGILGRYTECPNCGCARGSDVTFYSSNDTLEVTNPELLKIAKAGPDWNCEFCDASNRATQEKCDNCGAPKGSSPNHKVGDYTPPPQEKPIQVVQNSPNSESYSSTREPEKYPATIRADAYDNRAKPFNTRKAVVIASISGGIFFTSLLLFLIFSTKDVPITLTRVTWERTIEIEMYKTVQEEDWDVPSGGRVKKSEKKIHHYDKVLDHNETKYKTEKVKVGTKSEEYKCGEKDLGNGFSEDIKCPKEVDVYENQQVEYQEPVYRQDPVYGTWYTYEIERWKPERSVYAAGTDLSPNWPEVKLNANEPKILEAVKAKGINIIGAEKEGQRTQKYVAYFHDLKKNKTYEKTMDLGEWQKLQINQMYNGKVNHFDMLMKIEPLEK